MMDKKKIAVCIPTYNRDTVIWEFLKYSAPRYWKKGIDIRIYDSSENDRTEHVVENYIEEGRGLFYQRIDSNVHSNMKVYNIFREFENSQEYDYLWVCSDSIRWSNLVLDKVCRYMNENYDFIIPNYRDVEGIGTKEYCDHNQFFLDCAWHMTLYGATVVKISTVIRNVDWDYLIKTYCVPDSINHSHVAFYFEQLLKMENWKAIHFGVLQENLTASALKVAPGWHSNTFYVWCHCWPYMVEHLPEIYKYKAEVVKKSGVNSKTFSMQAFRILRCQGILTWKDYCQYRGEWRKLTDVSPFIIALFSILPRIFMRKGELRLMIKGIIIPPRIRRFCKKYTKIYIYGAGGKAWLYTKYLEKMRIDYEGYLVSKSMEFVDSLNNHGIIEFRKELLEDQNLGILLALNKKNTKEVLNTVFCGLPTKQVFSEYRKK